MTILLNGQEYQTQATDIAALMREIDAPQNGVAVALNDRVVRRAEHETTTLHEDDGIEVIRAVQGG